jgi:hypothetical protein
MVPLTIQMMMLVQVMMLQKKMLQMTNQTMQSMLVITPPMISQTRQLIARTHHACLSPSAATK